MMRGVLTRYVGRVADGEPRSMTTHEVAIVEVDLPNAFACVVLQETGELTVVHMRDVRVTDPEVVDQPRDPTADHDHALGNARPVLEEGRVVGTRRPCMVDGCGYATFVPVKPA